MNVRLAAQTLSSSVADAIEFLDVSMKLPEFQDSQPTVTFTRTIDRRFDILNSRIEIQLEKVTSNPYDHNQKTPGNQCSKQQQTTC